MLLISYPSFLWSEWWCRCCSLSLSSFSRDRIRSSKSTLLKKGSNLFRLICCFMVGVERKVPKKYRFLKVWGMWISTSILQYCHTNCLGGMTILPMPGDIVQLTLKWFLCLNPIGPWHKYQSLGLYYITGSYFRWRFYCTKYGTKQLFKSLEIIPFELLISYTQGLLTHSI